MVQSIQNNPRRAKINLCVQVAERSQGAHGLAGAGARAWVPSLLWMILGRAAMVDTGRAGAGSVSGPHAALLGGHGNEHGAPWLGHPSVMPLGGNVRPTGSRTFS